LPLLADRLHSPAVVTKRQLGLILLIAGLVSLAVVLGIDVLSAGRFQGLGPIQRLALAPACLLVVVGLSLLPLGDRPA
jgi:hypothetical protein